MVLDLELGQEREIYLSVVCVSQVGREIHQPCLGSRTEHAGDGSLREWDWLSVGE